jgi:hypothetical protein
LTLLEVVLSVAAGAAMLTMVGWVVYQGIFKAEVGDHRAQHEQVPRGSRAVR